MNNAWLPICGTVLYLWSNHSTTFRALRRFEEIVA